MRRSLLILLAGLISSATIVGLSSIVAKRLCARHFASPSDDLVWLRREFRLNDAEMQRVRQLHEGYLPKCRGFCERLDARKRELQATLASGANAPAVIELKLIEIGTIRAQCQAAMLQHFREVSQVMPEEQGRRYLSEMQRQTLGFHEQIEKTMSADPSAPHGHP
jgi:hypothetical protein